MYPMNPPRALFPTLISLILPLALRLHHPTLVPPSLFILIALFALLTEKGYRDILERFSPEFSEHTGPFSHIGVCLLAHMFVQNVKGWRGEVLFWMVFFRWAFGMSGRWRRGLNLFREAYTMRFRCAGVRIHALLVATILTPVFVTEGMKWVQIGSVWLHFYHSMGYMFAFSVYFCFPGWRCDLVDRFVRKEESLHE